jgi:hypothetical protein
VTARQRRERGSRGGRGPSKAFCKLPIDLEKAALLLRLIGELLS